MNLNQHIIQGIQFKQFEKNYQRDNEHKLLENSSASFSTDWGSIVEALTSAESTQQQSAVATLQLSADRLKLNRLITEYATLYNTYTSTMIHKAATDKVRISMETDLAAKHSELVILVNKINKNVGTNFSEIIDINQFQFNENITKLTHQQHVDLSELNKYDTNTMNGAIETTQLNMNSMYYHYMVYFLISLTLIAFTFNILVNPNANTLSAIIVVSSVVLIYIIARHYTIPI